MIFSSIPFLLYFFPVFFLLYALVPKSFRNLWLLAGSVLFYAWGAPSFVFILMASTIIDFHLVKRLHQSVQPNIRKRWLALSITLNLGLLAYFKYANFFVDNINFLLTSIGLKALPMAGILLPIGISFYTFQTLTYSIDIYRKEQKPLSKVTDYVLYIMMFPQLIAGPIVRFGEISNQITHRVFSNQNVVEGFIRFCIGLGKKVLIANTLAITADEIFKLSSTNMTSAGAWLGIICYTFQIYFDFAGYSDMAIGMGQMLGFKFPENFNSPYTSYSITQFWRKWHITLGHFMRDYLYKPLGGNRLGVSKTYRNLFIVFLLSGLWHGSSWNFVLWGAFHGSFLVIERLTGLAKLERLKGLRIVITFILVILGWVIFRTETLQEAELFYTKLFTFDGGIPIQVYSKKTVLTLLVAFLFSFIALTPIGHRWQNHFYSTTYSIKSLLTYFSIAIVTLLWSISTLATGAFNPFIYFRF